MLPEIDFKLPIVEMLLFVAIHLSVRHYDASLKSAIKTQEPHPGTFF